jgi:hypothetical protein
MKPPSQQPAGPGAVDLIEEAVHLLRRHPRELAGYFAGTGPFAVALLYFWAYVTWFAPPDGAVAAGALLLAVLFGWMKAGQHRFALRLLACRLGEEPLRWTARQWFAEMAAQLRLHASGVVLVPLAALFTVPFGWIYAYYQSATVLPPGPDGDTAARRSQAWEQMRLWPAQNHWALAMLSGLWLMVFLNLAVAFYLVPSLATKIFGLKTVFAMSGWSYLNTTFLALVAVLTHLLVDPLIKTFYLLRVFHGRARHTGADLRLVLARERVLRRRLASGLALLMVAAVLLTGPVARAAEPALLAPGPQAAPAPVLNPALDRVLEQPEYRWRLRPLPAPPEKEKEGIIKGFVRSTFATLAQIIRTVYRWIDHASQWVSDLFPGGKKSGDKEGGDAAKAGARNAFDWMAALQLVSYLLLAAVAGLLIFVIWKVWAHNRAAVPLPAGPAPAPASTPDLREENVEASRLPADGWLELARQQMAAGEWRLALRALFLATLARHAHEGLLSLAKFKTNLDYETELRRRAHSRTVLVEEFRGRRRQFEEVWYGAAPASDKLVRDWLHRMEGPA